MGASTATVEVSRPNIRPITLSANARKISYRSKSGNVLTLELKNSNKAVDSMREITIRKPAKPDTDIANEELSAQPKQSTGLWPDVYDTLSFWCMEAVEIAAFGPYDQPRK